jgi:D-lactate dehydrogenase (cytochrome)
MIQSGIPVARVELLDEEQMKAINAYAKASHPARPTLFFEFHGSPQAVTEQREATKALARDFGAESFRTADSQEERTALWRARHQALYATVALRPGGKAWVSDVCVPISHLSACITATKEIMRRSFVPATIVGHVGDGNFHVIFNVMPDDPAEMQEVSRINGEMIKLALASDGTCTGEHGVGTGKLDYMEAEHGDALDLMSAVKAALDPQNIFNPGKIIPPARRKS